MAEHNEFSEIKLLKNSKIVVNVEESLQDVIVVTYSLQNKFFQGVLLDSSKRLLPCGITPPPESLNKKTEEIDAGKFFSVSQRFTYFQDKPNCNGSSTNEKVLPHLSTSKTKPSSRLKPSRMTVRLRPRQVLCSKCKSICNENSENVDNSKSLKNETQEMEKTIENPLTQNKPMRTIRNLRPTLIPKLNRLKENEISSAINGKVFSQPPNNAHDSFSNPLALSVENVAPISAKEPKSPEDDLMNTTESTDKDDDEDGEGKMVLRKKRSVGSMEDLWDENVFVEGAKKARTTPVIKISFGSQGEGTVLKIPSKVQNCSESEPEEKIKTASAKAAKRALKKAKKEARRKMVHSPGASPAYEALHYRRHRHKVKHKKKHKEERTEDSVVYLDMKERCLKQKLSISLRRLNAAAYTHRSDSGSSESSSSGSSAEEAMPDFPALGPSGSGSAQSIASPSHAHAHTTCPFAAGDIVWGKIQGFPWWPGKVVQMCAGEENQAHVTWYGSSTSSLIPCHQLSPFLETFKSRFNKKKKSGPYKEAIRQATSEASDISQKIMHSPLRSIMSSPTPVHVQ